MLNLRGGRLLRGMGRGLQHATIDIDDHRVRPVSMHATECGLPGMRWPRGRGVKTGMRGRGASSPAAEGRGNGGVCHVTVGGVRRARTSVTQVDRSSVASCLVVQLRVTTQPLATGVTASVSA